MNAGTTATCQLHKPGRCYIPKEHMVFRVGQVVMSKHRSPGTPNSKYQVMREWIRTASGQHVAYCRYDCVTRTPRRYLYHSFPVESLIVVS